MEGRRCSALGELARLELQMLQDACHEPLASSLQSMESTFYVSCPVPSKGKGVRRIELEQAFAERRRACAGHAGRATQARRPRRMHAALQGARKLVVSDALTAWDVEGSLKLFLTWWLFAIRVSAGMPNEDQVFYRTAMCDLFGLAARRVGARRAGCSRSSPGIGVNRRSHRQQQAACHSASFAQDLPGAQRLDSCSLLCNNAVRQLCQSIVDVDDSLRGWQHKCLQNSVLQVLCSGDAASRTDVCLARRMLQSTCGNHAFTGGTTDSLASWNAYCTEMVLRRLRSFVWILGVESASAMRAGWVEGRWAFGDRQGSCRGLILWFAKERHACPVEGAYVFALLEEVPDWTGKL